MTFELDTDETIVLLAFARLGMESYMADTSYDSGIGREDALLALNVLPKSVFESLARKLKLIET